VPAEFEDSLNGALEDFEAATRALVEGAADDPAVPGSAAADYLELTGLVAYGWLWARMAGVSGRALEAGGDADRAFHEGKLATARFFHARLLPAAALLRQRIERGSAPLMELAAEGF
jgi:hypothetical protein